MHHLLKIYTRFLSNLVPESLFQGEWPLNVTKNYYTTFCFTEIKQKEKIIQAEE